MWTWTKPGNGSNRYWPPIVTYQRQYSSAKGHTHFPGIVSRNFSVIFTVLHNLQSVPSKGIFINPYRGLRLRLVYCTGCPKKPPIWHGLTFKVQLHLEQTNMYFLHACLKFGRTIVCSVRFCNTEVIWQNTNMINFEFDSRKCRISVFIFYFLHRF